MTVILWYRVSKCDALRDLVPILQIKEREKHPWRSVIFSKIANSSMGVFHVFRIVQMAPNRARYHKLISHGMQFVFIIAGKGMRTKGYTTHKWSFLLRISSVNVTKSGNCGFGHICWRNLNRKLHILCSFNIVQS